MSNWVVLEVLSLHEDRKKRVLVLEHFLKIAQVWNLCLDHFTNLPPK